MMRFCRIQEQLRRIKRNQEKEREKALQPKKKKEKAPNNVRKFIIHLQSYEYIYMCILPDNFYIYSTVEMWSLWRDRSHENK